MAVLLSRDEVVDRAVRLPAFPRVVTDILATLDDENSTIGALAHHVERDPVITARVLALANSAMAHAHPGASIRDVATATSMIGIARVREMVLAISLAEFARDSRVPAYFWEHSVAVGICAQELARHTQIPLDFALVAGLLHDIGQLWLAKFYPREYQLVRTAVFCGASSVNEVERKYFALDHCEVGVALAEYWALPESIAAAIACHHQPEPGLGEKLVAVVHVAEVLANALDLARREENQVSAVSGAACAAVGIDWNQDLRALFGTIEARAEHACAIFR